MFKSISNKELYDNSSLAFVFEFFTPLNKRELAAKLARALGKKVKWFTDVDSTFEPTLESFKISPVYSNGYKETSLSTGFMPYLEAIHMMLKVMNVIEALGYTTDRCSMTTRVRLNEDELGLTVKTDKLNKFKYLLGFDESKLFEMWPHKVNENTKVYRNQLRFIKPRQIYNTVVTESRVERMDPNEFNFPESDFFATDFSEMDRGNLILKYISGKDYHKKKKESVDSINFIIEHLYATLSNNYEYTLEEKKIISEITSELRDAVDSTRSYSNFKMKYPGISIYVDLKDDRRFIEANYDIIKERLFQLVFGGEISEGVINWDTRRKAFQVKDATVSRGILVENIEFYQCTVEVDAKGCLFEGCSIKSSKLSECTVFSNNFIKSSKIIDCTYMGENNDISTSFLDNSDLKMINADLRECLVNRGRLTINSTIDKHTKIIAKLR